MERAAAEGGIVFFDFQFFGLEFFVARGGVARRGFAFLAGFGAFDGDDLAGHDIYSFSLAGFSSTSSSSSASTPPVVSTVPSWPRRRWRKAPSRSSWLWASTVKRVHGMASRRGMGMGLAVNSQMP